MVDFPDGTSGSTDISSQPAVYSIFGNQGGVTATDYTLLALFGVALIAVWWLHRNDKMPQGAYPIVIIGILITASVWAFDIYPFELFPHQSCTGNSDPAVMDYCRTYCAYGAKAQWCSATYYSSGTATTLFSGDRSQVKCTCNLYADMADKTSTPQCTQAIATAECARQAAASGKSVSSASCGTVNGRLQPVCGFTAKSGSPTSTSCRTNLDCKSQGEKYCASLGSKLTSYACGRSGSGCCSGFTQFTGCEIRCAMGPSTPAGTKLPADPGQGCIGPNCFTTQSGLIPATCTKDSDCSSGYACKSGKCMVVVAASSTAALATTSTCGNGACDFAEDGYSCPSDCSIVASTPTGGAPTDTAPPSEEIPAEPANYDILLWIIIGVVILIVAVMVYRRKDKYRSALNP